MTRGADQCECSSWKFSALPEIILLISSLWGDLERPKGGDREV